ncbi:MAG: glutamate--tRNA ligase [Acidiphilium sp.]|nr:glutamate--tRNA ligase [Acidiphilium sp.]MDD4935264.1 glutamate--tRNA ligase [Acidiphilium sp.]
MITVRFAPSPTGYLHAGNARQAIVNFLFARANAGRLILRIDDTDTERSRPEYEAAIEQDLAWLGITWDEKIKQSDRLARYTEAAETLKKSGRLYPCFESEDELAAKRALRAKRKLPPIYDRAMLALTPAQRAAAEANGKTPYWRFKLSDGSIAWNDLVLGCRDIRLNTISDPVLIRADGTPLYTFTSIVDDLDMAITHIIRGEDHVTNTAAQIDLFHALAPRKPLPEFAHLPLISDISGDKLSKRSGSISLRTLRRDGIEPQALAAYLARLGSRRDPEPLTLAELAETFNLEAFSRGAPRFDAKQLLTLNRRILHTQPYEAVADRLPENATEAFWLAIRENLDLLSEARLWWTIITALIDPPDLPEAQTLLETALKTLPPEPWDHTTWKSWTTTIAAETGTRGKALYMPLRLALTGETHGPELAALLPLMSRELVVERLERAVR